ncbi:MAG: PQQ-dependent dehydrogenase, methanol/ethanol family, partial [Mesorhizobium sp.]
MKQAHPARSRDHASLAGYPSALRRYSPSIFPTLLLACATLLMAASQPPPAPAISPPAAAAPPDDGQWTMPAKNYASTRYSELSEINEGNVKNLQVAFTFSTGVNKGQEAAPLVVGNTMYIVTPFPNIVYALDLSK